MFLDPFGWFRSDNQPTEYTSKSDVADAASHWGFILEDIVPENIELFFIPPYTPEMNPIEQIWKELRKRGFNNKLFASLANVINRLCDTINSLTADVIKSITGRDWILKCFISD